MNTLPFVCLAALWGGLGAVAQSFNGITAVVHTSVVTQGEVRDFARPALEAAARQARDAAEFRREEQRVMADSLSQLVDRQLILRDFQTIEAKGYNLPESLIDELVKDRIREQFGDRRTAIKSLQARGLTFERYRRQVREQIIIEILRSRNVSASLIISPRKLEQYYQQQQTNFMVPDRVRLRILSLPKQSPDDAEARRLAEDIARQVREGADFADMARTYSVDGQRAQGGDRGWVTRGFLAPALDEAAFQLTAGEVSPVIETPQFCYLLKAEEVRPAHIRPLSEVREALERDLLDKERTRLNQQYTEKLKKKTFVRFF
jgi:parvulin-like peptidyl-prolyl isomerase